MKYFLLLLFKFNLLALTYKVLNGLGYLNNHLCQDLPAHAVNSSRKALLVVLLPATETQLVSTRNRAFLVVTPQL